MEDPGPEVLLAAALKKLYIKPAERHGAFASSILNIGTDVFDLGRGVRSSALLMAEIARGYEISAVSTAATRARAKKGPSRKNLKMVSPPHFRKFV